MYFKQFLDECCGCASYLIASRESCEAVIVDPALDTAQYDAILMQRRLYLRYVVDTHIHADHVSGARQLAARHGATLCLHESAHVSYPFHPLTEKAQLALGELHLEVLHTPGHRPELITLMLRNVARSDAPSLVLTGDSLLVGDVGRPDFGGGDAEAQSVSIQRLMDLPDWVAVFPGHFEGLCGKGMCGRPSSTVGFERRFNPLLQLDRAAFITALTSDLPARPLNMLAIEATNRGLADMSWAMPTTQALVPEVTIHDLAVRPTDSVVLDVREEQEYRQGHVPAARNLPQAELASRLDEVPRDRPVYLICARGTRSQRAAQFLTQVGITSVTHVAGGTAAWHAAGKSLTTSEV